MTQFFQSISLVLPEGAVQEKNGLSYLPAATAWQMAGRPSINAVDFEGDLPFRQDPLVNGLLVAARCFDTGQMTWLPVLDHRNQVAVVKAIALCTGVGLSLYAGFSGDGAAFADALGVTPESTNLERVIPLSGEKKSGGKAAIPYLEWAVAHAVAKVTDPEFFWEALPFEVPHPETGEVVQSLIQPVLNGFRVRVRMTWRGTSLVQDLPVMDGSSRPLAKVSVADWNRAVMRALARP